MASAVDIVNSALLKIGVEPLTSLSEDNKAGRLANKTYDVIRDSLIYDHYWNFAVKRKALALDPTPAITGGNRFALPADCHRPIRLMSSYPYKIESGFLIVQEVNEANLLYVWKNTDVSTYTSKFKEALSYRLAAEWAFTLTQTVSLADLMERKAANFVLEAAATDAQEDYQDNVHDDGFLNSHYAESDYPATLRGYSV